ncbi:unnamed protein product [Ilex paraguariensis]|uniref:PWWP domain-containing protein n=1 Tax=Ilex paraguariensis TaxID=185542 RepID=A0ABC8SCH6_9AQUA
MKLDDIDLNSDAVPVEPNTEVYGSNFSESNDRVDISESRTLIEPSITQEDQMGGFSIDSEIGQARVSAVGVVPECCPVMGFSGTDGGLETKVGRVENGDVGGSDSQVGDLRQIGGKSNKISFVVDLSPRSSAYGKFESGNGNGNGDKGTKIEEFSGDADTPLLDSLVDNVACHNNNNNNNNISVVLNGNQAVVNEQDATDIDQRKYNNNIKTATLKELRTEKQGEYHVADLVWGKVRSHPWWPGQIFDPSAASAKARKYSKKDGHLIAYFGDQTFAWNDASRIKPFQMHFSQMEKQSSMEAFCRAVDCALDEVCRRVEFGLACSCSSEEEYAKIKTQVVLNAGIREESSRRDGSDDFSSAASFMPTTFVQYLKELAQAPSGATDRLEFLIARAQLLAFNRWKGYDQLPVLEVFDGLLENDASIPRSLEKEDSDEVIEDAVAGSEGEEQDPSIKIRSVIRHSTSRKRKHISGDGLIPSKKERSIVDLIPGSSLKLQNNDSKIEKNSGRKITSLSSGKKCQAVDSVSRDSMMRHQKSHFSPGSVSKMTSQPKELLEVGERISRVASLLADSTPILKSQDKTSQKAVAEYGGKLAKSLGTGKARKREKVISAQYPPPDEMLSELCLTARDPMKGYGFLMSMASFFSDFRKSICLENSSSWTGKESIGKVPGNKKRKKSSNLENCATFGFEGIEDSYWTDRVIQGNSEEQVLFETETPIEKAMPTLKQEAAVDIIPNFDNKQETTDGIIGLEAEKPTGQKDEECKVNFPTALILNFTNLESVPSVADLNKIFSRFGPLNESETEVLSKSKRAKVVFKRHSDADTAFSSAGKFSIFGPSLVSYSLKYSPPRKTSTPASKRNKKGTSMQGNGV